MNNDYISLEIAAKNLASNSYFVEINNIRNKFNIFLATDMQSREIKHTKFLCYLLNPNESHGLGDEFLMRFLQRLPKQLDNKLDLLDLNINYSKIITEKSLESENKDLEKEYGRIDLILEIPSINQSSKNHVLIIENKLKSRQGHDQLKRYRNIAERYYSNTVVSMNYFYLTLDEEEPNDEHWTPVYYSDLVIPAIEDLIKYSAETISEYLKNILIDYMDLIETEDESQALCEELARKIEPHLITDLLLANSILATNLPPNYNRLLIKYSKAISFLRSYKGDPRLSFAEYFKTLFDSRKDGLEYLKFGKENLYYENSTLKYLRFGFLNSENSKVIQSFSQQSKIDWLKGSKRHLAMEFTLTNSANDISLFDVSLKIVLGPFGEQYKSYRQGIYDSVNKSISLKNEKIIESTNHSGIPLNEYKVKKLNETDAKDWIKDSLLRLSNDPIIDKINHDLSEHFLNLSP